MSQHVMTTCNESNGSWLPLIEYSIKSGLSLSTIRRKIKSNSIPYRLERGKYLIFFREGELREDTLAESSICMNESISVPDNEMGHSVKMVAEAFEFALKEKEARILTLEKRNRELTEEITELKILVRVLEEKFNVRY